MFIKEKHQEDKSKQRGEACSFIEAGKQEHHHVLRFVKVRAGSYLSHQGRKEMSLIFCEVRVLPFDVSHFSEHKTVGAQDSDEVQHRHIIFLFFFKKINC